jgi:hypothetical protein
VPCQRQVTESASAFGGLVGALDGFQALVLPQPSSWSCNYAFFNDINTNKWVMKISCLLLSLTTKTTVS